MPKWHYAQRKKSFELRYIQEYNIMPNIVKENYSRFVGYTADLCAEEGKENNIRKDLLKGKFTNVSRKRKQILRDLENQNK